MVRQFKPPYHFFCFRDNSSSGRRDLHFRVLQHLIGSLTPRWAKREGLLAQNGILTTCVCLALVVINEAIAEYCTLVKRKRWSDARPIEKGQMLAANVMESRSFDLAPGQECCRSWIDSMPLKY